MDFEFYLATAFIVALALILVKIIWSCFVAPVIEFIKLKIYEKKHGKEIGEVDTQTVQELFEKRRFEDFIKSYEETGKIPDPDVECKSNPFIEGLIPCEELYSNMSDCPCSPQRADFCRGEMKNGKLYCKTLININNTVGIESSDESKYLSHNPTQLTEEEAKILTNVLLRFYGIKSKDSTE